MTERRTLQHGSWCRGELYAKCVLDFSVEDQSTHKIDVLAPEKAIPYGWQYMFLSPFTNHVMIPQNDEDGSYELAFFVCILETPPRREII